MREIKYRAWVEKTVDNQLRYSVRKTEEEFAHTKPSWGRYERAPREWGEWVDATTKRREELREEWELKFDESEKYSKFKYMSNDIFVNGKKMQIPYLTEVISVMQYTGLKDIHGTEIYEGDILRVDWMFDGFVNYGNGSFYIDTGASSHYRWVDYDVEVIGNIHENPELMDKHLNKS